MEIHSLLLTTSDTRNENVHTSAVLDNTKLKELDNFYRLTDSQYSALVSAYSEEREIAKAKRQLKDFPPLSLWNPGSPKHQQLAISLQCGPSNKINCFRTYILKKGNGNTVKYSTHSLCEQTSQPETNGHRVIAP